MNYIDDINNLKLNNTAVALGKFEGLHLGHMLLADKLIELSEKEGVKSVVCSFDMQGIFSGEDMLGTYTTLLTYEEKQTFLSKKGIDILVRYNFTREFASLQPEEFVKEILVEKFDAKYVVVGTDFRFGYKRAGNVDTLKQLGEKYGFIVFAIEKLCLESPNDPLAKVEVSSSKINVELNSGSLESANRYLGYNYFIEGTVVKGKQIGRTIGFPTINLEYSEHKQTPKIGVYVTNTIIDGVTYKSVTNVGKNPTIADNNQMTVETHILDFDKDIYGKKVTVEFLGYIRGEQKFNSLDELKTQLEKDIEKAR